MDSVRLPLLPTITGSSLNVGTNLGGTFLVSDTLAIAPFVHGSVWHEFAGATSSTAYVGFNGNNFTFPLTTGDPEFLTSAIETIEGIRAIEAAMPGVLTVLGVSNVSFGINPAARKVINAVFLYHCIKAGLDLAIIHPSHVVPFAEIPSCA